MLLCPEGPLDRFGTALASILEAFWGQVEVMFDSIRSCMYAVQTGEDNILISQEPIEEVEKFVNSLITYFIILVIVIISIASILYVFLSS